MYVIVIIAHNVWIHYLKSSNSVRVIQLDQIYALHLLAVPIIYILICLNLHTKKP